MLLHLDTYFQLFNDLAVLFKHTRTHTECVCCHLCLSRDKDEHQICKTSGGEIASLVTVDRGRHVCMRAECAEQRCVCTLSCDLCWCSTSSTHTGSTHALAHANSLTVQFEHKCIHVHMYVYCSSQCLHFHFHSQFHFHIRTYVHNNTISCFMPRLFS